MTNHNTTTLIRTHEDLPAVHETVVDGVQTFWVDAGPPFAATLMFRVGVSDETLATRGITHLVEHLALSALRDVAHPFNGSVSGDEATFWAAGSEKDVLAFVSRLIDQLAALPLERLELETGVLIAEEMQRPGSSMARLLTQRFGPHGPGLMGFSQSGLRRLTGDEIQRWATDRFTAENAVLVLAGPPPDSLRLPLPVGIRRPLVLPPDNYGFDMTGRTRVGHQTDGVAVGAFGSRSTELTMAGQIVAARAQERLRHELGRVYSVGHEYLRLTAEEAYLYWGADSAPEHTVEVTEAFGGVLDELATTGPTTVEIAHQVAMAEQMFTLDRAAVAREVAHRVAGAMLRGHPVHRFSDVLEEMHAATPQGIAAALADAMQHAMAIATDEADIGFAAAAFLPDAAPAGRTIRIKRGGAIHKFVLNADVVGMLVDGDWVALRFNELELVDQSPNGARLLIDQRGAWMVLAPESRRERRLIAEIDERVPPRVVVPATRAE